MGLKLEYFYWMAAQSQIVADEMCRGRVVTVLEGGYDVSKAVDGLATYAEAHAWEENILQLYKRVRAVALFF